ncbi:MAG: hypothetical protein IPK18_04230 [Sphingobacteriales bacterium]|jgi:hypothetical protein|nr:MAG: hypothetical protein IPK18_04230 [Sphingobacteriales bacterium]
MLKSIKFYIVFIFIAGVFFVSCKKDKFNTVDLVQFSNDTLKFDTIFTTLGSTTKLLTIVNPHKEKIIIDELSIASSSLFRINVDGDTGRIFNTIEIPAKDSIYVFVELTINPNSETLPYIVLDSILLKLNNKQQKVMLQAYGQNAHFYDNEIIGTNTIWNNDLPYVILNTLLIDAGASLTINAGTTVYFGGNASMIVKGNLTINGNNDTSEAVLFRGYRLDKDINGTLYDKYPGQWLGLFFLRGSTGNINNFNLRNSYYGLNVGNIETTDDDAQNLASLQNATLSNGANIILKNSKIYNNSFYGIFGFLSTIIGENILCYGAGTNAVGLYYGGHYQFTNSTFFAGNNPYISHSKTPVFYFNNFFSYSSTAPSLFADSSLAIINNSIIYGTLDEEVFTDEDTDNPNKLYYQFLNSCIKTKATNINANTNYTNCISNDPKFENIGKFNFQLQNGSPCIDAGNNSIVYPLVDIKGNTRVGNVDIGVYEKQ